MAVSVLLSLSEPVSVPDLRQFLSYLPEDFDLQEDLRMQFDGQAVANYLEIGLTPSRDQERE